ncbi:NAD(P)-binding domain-containing protein [Defluviimonas sp. WL0050]|uniref:Pyrroline-5-carboxylate reductase n=1 Tax=Albidovulum litorale TaxID=2984134 RepID=A0ABT2ZLW8_9RHOB|nr:pyrroline-5-carboxylate reductase dimerization domain-containing protein [Defluviimonas sp. WL0050]MCV2872112.1 NAD(P)-binding domain-containing protein [Defluviimonas sp. WL0050]
MRIRGKLGIVGGNGQLGSAIAQGLLTAGAIAPEDLWISARSGRAEALDNWPGIAVTTDNMALAGACDTILMSVPPAGFGKVGITAPDRLVVSVMAGVTRERLSPETGAARVVRAMSSPAAADRMAYSPWIGSAAVTDADRETIHALFSAIGQTDELDDEAHIDHFTAMTGPVPGFVALYADCMIRYACAAGIAPETAERAVRQLFLSSGAVLGASQESPAEQVRAMVDYAGTTAAGLLAMERAGLEEVIATGLDAAVARARRIGEE